MADDTQFINKRAPTLYVIIGIKLLKGTMLLLLALGVYSLSDNKRGASLLARQNGFPA